MGQQLGGLPDTNTVGSPPHMLFYNIISAAKGETLLAIQGDLSYINLAESNTDPTTVLGDIYSQIQNNQGS